ncbi:MAG: D-glycero-beta-D-manno-heptose-7-phosphate kinase [bacterium]|nr:D-glycero-beta-D-manno-heptose-7-phosphate kinase [bacterium]
MGTDHAQLIEELKRYAGQRVLVIGDVMLDEYHWCDVSRISPEAPVPVCRVKNTTYVPGGAGNVVFNIKALGGTPYVVGRIGDDSTGARLKSEFERGGINHDLLIQEQGESTILKSRIVARTQHIVRVDREHVSKLSNQTADQLLEKIKSVISTMGAVVISDYDKGLLTPYFIDGIVAMTKAANKPLIVDPKGEGYEKYKGATVVTPNFSEFQTAVRETVTDEARIQELGAQLRNRIGVDTLVITRSEKGMSIIGSDGAKQDIPTRAKEVADITGAGDTVIAGIAVGLAAGLAIPDAVHIANFAAGVVVAKVGTSVATPQEVVIAIERDQRAQARESANA